MANVIGVGAWQISLRTVALPLSVRWERTSLVKGNSQRYAFGGGIAVRTTGRSLKDSGHRDLRSVNTTKLRAVDHM